MNIIIKNINIKSNYLNINYGLPNIPNIPNIPNPTASPKGGIYNTTQYITLKAISNATIFYNIEKSSIYHTYSGVISINNSSTLNFYATLNNLKSDIVSENYIILPPLKASPNEGIYSAPQNITLKAFSDDASIYYSTNTLNTQLYTGSFYIYKSDNIKAFYIYKGVKSENTIFNYTILPPLVATPKEGLLYSFPQNVILKAFSDDASIYYSTNTLDTQQYQGSINVSNYTSIAAFYLYKGIKSESRIFNYNITDFGTENNLGGKSTFNITSDFKGGAVYGQQYFTKIFNLNRLQYNIRIGLYSGFFTKNLILNNMKSNPTQLDKENFLKTYMKCIYRNKENTINLFSPTDIDISQWPNNFCLYKGVKGSPCRCYDDYPNTCYSNFPPNIKFTNEVDALNSVLIGKSSGLSQSIEGGPLISPVATPSITNLPNYIYGSTNNYYRNINNMSYWKNSGTDLIDHNDNYGFCLLSNKILTLPSGVVFDDSNKGDNYFGLVNYSIDLINNIKGSTKALTHTYYINSQNYKGYTNCILPSFFTLDDKYGFDNYDTMQYKPIKGSRGYQMEINKISGIEYKGVLKIPKLFMPKGNDIELLRDVYTMNNNLYNTKADVDTYYKNIGSGSYYDSFNYNGIHFKGLYTIYNKGNSALLHWDNLKQEISEYWKLNDKGDAYIATDSTEVDQNLVNYEFPKYNLPFNYTKSSDYKEFTKSISVNINDMFDRNIKISYQWVKFIDQITIRKYKEKLLKDNTKADVDTYLNNLQTKIENFHKGNSLESSFYPKTDLKSDQLAKLLDIQLVTPPSEFSYGYVPEVFEMIYT